MSFPTSVLIVGGSGGLGSALVKQYAKTIGGSNVFATTRSQPKPDQFPEGVNVIDGIDVSKEESAGKIVDGLKGRTVQVVIYVSGILVPEVSLVGSSVWDSGSCDHAAGAFFWVS